MGFKGVKTSIVVVLVLAIRGGATAQSGCTRVLMGLSPCLNFVTRNSSTPSSSCCSQLSGVVQSQPQCLCALVNGAAASLGVAVNRTLALALPSACSVPTPPVSQCDSANEPTASSTDSPIGSPSDSSTPDSNYPL